MNLFTLFELFLVVFTFYAILNYEGTMRAVVPLLCLVTMFLFERLRGKMKEAEESKRRLLKYQREERLTQEVCWEPYGDGTISDRMKDIKGHPVR